MEPKKLRLKLAPTALNLMPPRLRLYSEVMNLVLKVYADGQAIAEADTTILRHTQPPYMTPLQYGEDLSAKAICVGDVNDEGTLNERFIEGVDE